MFPALSEVMSYTNPHAITSYKLSFPEKKDKAEVFFTELLKYLWLCKKHEYDLKLNPDDENLKFLLVMHQEMRDIDDMWHGFILFTKEYMSFCDKYFDSFIHHVPNLNIDIPQTPEQFEKDLFKYLSYVYDHLGEETVRLWFKDYV